MLFKINMGLLGGKKRVKGTIIHAREILGRVRIEVEVGKASVASLFTGAVDNHRLRGRTVNLTLNKIDTRKEELKILKQQRIAKLRALEIERRRVD